jgi:small nuclear ribonucleoprotein (snRNP)-like protein
MNENERRMQVESRILGTMLRRLAVAGWSPDAILLDEGWEKTPTRKEVRALFDDLDEITLRVRNAEGRTYGILLIRGNGVDLISDYSYGKEGTDNFETTMNAILDYVTETYDSWR